MSLKNRISGIAADVDKLQKEKAYWECINLENIRSVIFHLGKLDTYPDELLKKVRFHYTNKGELQIIVDEKRYSIKAFDLLAASLVVIESK